MLLKMVNSFFQNPESLIIGVFIILLVISYTILIRFFRERGIAMIVSILIALISSYGLYKKDFHEWEGSLAAILVLVIIFIFIRLFSPLLRNVKLSYGR